jgi:pantoate--beta-alanine ligase
MDLFQKIAPFRQKISELKKNGNTIGFVPTMGALHQGHISLLEESLKENDCTIASIFVNPVQFNNPDDFRKYPRVLEEDLRKLKATGCHITFSPETEEIYPDKPLIGYSFGYLDDLMEGKFRRGHFSGVALVVNKFFNLVQPDKAYFGQKDLQQFVIIDRMVSDLNIPVTLRRMAVIREHDGLAMSSRNQRLSPENRKSAPLIYSTLQEAVNKLKEGINVVLVKEQAIQKLNSVENFTPEYFEIVDSKNLNPLSYVKKGQEIAICTAVFAGNVRLIDNVIVALPH